jgi:phenylalanyl-tRNA synthetase beta chain
VPPIRYTTVLPDGIKFVPLDFDEELTPAEILRLHPKGREYGHIISEYSEYPLMIDSKDNVLSMPPIINSVYTGKVTPETKNVFIELTGWRLERLNVALNVIVAALHDRGGEIQSVEVQYPNHTIVTPDLTLKEFKMDFRECKKILGLEISKEDIISLLAKARYEATFKDGSIVVKYPPYRDDIMHQRDVMEDVAIAYGINSIQPEPPKISTIGKEDEKEELCDSIREAMVGLGFQEILTFSLTNKDFLFKKMNLVEERVCEIENPVSANWTALRNWLLPSLLEFLTYNLHVEFPQRIFEVGDIVEIDEQEETSTRTVKKLACVITDAKVSYEDISSVVDSLLRNLGISYKLKKVKHNSFILNRVAEVKINKEHAGVVGEIHPIVLNNWGLEKPLVAFELNVDLIFNIIRQYSS